MRNLIAEMQASVCDAPEIEQQVDAVVNALAALPKVAECHEARNRCKDALDNYADYAAQPTKAHASAYISAALESHREDAQQSEVYMRYIATRPRAERLSSHGLFGDADYGDLRAAMDELEHYEGNVWTHIISLKREDAERLGYDIANAWRELLRAKRNVIAEAMHIPPNDFRWYAAFHNEGHHPHVHMMAWSAKPGQSYLSRDGIAQIKSTLANQIFLHEMTQLCQQKSFARNELVQESRHALMELTQKICSGVANAPELEDKLLVLSQTMREVKGKHQYGYLKAPVKRQVDEIVDGLEGFRLISDCYDRWLELQNRADSYYKDEQRKRLRLSEEKTFRAIKNAVIAAADRLNAGDLTFEDKRMDDEPNELPDETWGFYRLRKIILDKDEPIEDRDAAVEELTELAEDDQNAQYFLGTLYRDGGLLLPDDEQAERWFRRAAEGDHAYAAYALGKLLQSQERPASEWYEQAAAQGNEYAQYRLAKLHLTGEGVEKDVGRAVELLDASAERGNPYADYLLGKLYLDGSLVQQDTELGMAHMERAAAQGNAYAQFFVNRRDSLKPSSVMLSITRVFHSMGQIFQNNSLPQSGGEQLGIDPKRLQELIEWKGYRASMSYAKAQAEEQEHNSMSMATPW